MAIRPGRYASIDIGTVTSRMLVADVAADGAFSELYRGYEVTNLGEGVDETGVLKPEAIERVAAAVRGFCHRLDDMRATDGVPIETRAVTTSAARDAANAAELVARLADEGVALQVVAGQKEAQLSFAGAAACFEGRPITVVDVGGGSTEVICGTPGQQGIIAHSFNVGCRRITERLLKSDPPAACELEQARSFLAQELRPHFAELAERGIELGTMVAVAGTATSVVSMREKMVCYDANRVHLAHVPYDDVGALVNRMASLTLEQRMQVTGLDPKRAPVIVAGLLILQEVMDAGGFDAYVASETDVLHGIIMDAMWE